jgi:hypothetical protein
MPNLFKNKKLIFLMFLLLGCGYFSIMSNLEMNYFAKSELILIPLQLLAIIYLTYVRLNRRQPSIDER